MKGLSGYQSMYLPKVILNDCHAKTSNGKFDTCLKILNIFVKMANTIPWSLQMFVFEGLPSEDFGRKFQSQELN